MSKARLAAMKVKLMALLKQLQMQYEFAKEDKIKDDIFINQNHKLIAEIIKIQKNLGENIFRNLLSKYTSSYPNPIPMSLFLKIFPPIECFSNNISAENNIEEQPVIDHEFSFSLKSDYIYHYTTSNILSMFFNKNESLYVTHWSFLNDSSELEKYRNRFRLLEKDPVEIPIFLMSFSYMKDDISQWRAYAANGGFSIGFDCNELLKSFDDKIYLSECTYKNIITDVSDKNAFCFCKNPAFKSEKEIRLLFKCSREELNNRIEIIGNKPRIKLKLKTGITIPSLIKEIIVSPHGNVEYNYNLANFLCGINHVQPSIIIRSRIPYRKW